MRYYIDGHNVLGAMEMPGDEKSIRSLIAKLATYQTLKKAELILVFDNKTNMEPYSLYERHGSLHVYASDPRIDKDADDCLVRKLSTDPKRASLTVVTRDRELQGRLRAVGAKHFMEPERFMQIVNSVRFSPLISKPEVQDDPKADDLTDAERDAITREMSETFGVSGHQ